MTKKLLTPICLLLFIFTSSAQPQPTANLTVFSEDGDKFFLILNGERQNNVAQTNLRMEDLPQPYYNAKIIFEDKTIPEINKNYLQLADADGAMMDVTYKIKRDKNNGKVTLKYFSMVPIQQNYRAPENVTVVRYGTPMPAATTVTQTTTQTTSPNSVNTSINVPGVTMNVTINDPVVETTTTHTTTTTTTHQTEVNTPPVQVGCNGSYPMGSGDFSSALSTIKGQGFSDTQLKTAKQIASSNCLSTNQISEICKVFGFEETKLDFAKFAYSHCTEQKNYFKVNNVFSFSSSSDDLNEYIQGH